MNWFDMRGIRRTDGDTVLDIPDIRQQGDYDCGAACLDAVLQFHGVRTCTAVLSMSNPVQGTSPDTLEALARAAGRPVISGTMTCADLKHYTASGRPVICPVSWHGGHWIVVAGVARGWVHYHDPEDGPLKMRTTDFTDRWRDVTRNGHEYDRWGIAVG